MMTISSELLCDGCGQEASAEHIARRLRRLEWTTRYRPVHINTLLLGAFSPQEERDFLYAPGGEFHGEAGHLLDALAISTAGKAADAVHAEFQRAGFFLTHVLECPLDSGVGQGKALRVRWSCAGNFGCKVKRGARKRRGGLTHWAGAKWPLGVEQVA